MQDFLTYFVTQKIAAVPWSHKPRARLGVATRAERKIASAQKKHILHRSPYQHGVVSLERTGRTSCLACVARFAPPPQSPVATPAIRCCIPSFWCLSPAHTVVMVWKLQFSGGNGVARIPPSPTPNEIRKISKHSQNHSPFTHAFSRYHDGLVHLKTLAQLNCISVQFFLQPIL